MDLGEEKEIVEIPEPVKVPDHAPEKVPVPERVDEPVPA